MSDTMTEEDFDWLCGMIRQESAIVLEPGKEYLAESRLHPIARKEGYESVAHLVRDLIDGRVATELKGNVVDAMTTNETSFFRDIHPWETLKHELIPELLERNARLRQLTVWCGAASSGQEPYTLALLLREHFAEALEGWHVQIVATDLSPSMLERAATGKYNQLEVNRGLPAAMLVRWFERAGMGWQLADEVRRMVSFHQVNLDDRSTWGAVPNADIVFLRNVLIYFDIPTKQGILQAVADHLVASGVLFLGSAETTVNVVDCFDRHQSGKTVYFRRR